MANESAFLKNFTDGTLTVKDGTGSPVALVVQNCQGDFGLSGLSADQKEIVAYQTRGALSTLRTTNQSFPTGSFSIMMSELSDGTLTTLVDFLLKQGSYSSNVSTIGTATSSPYAVLIELQIEGTDAGDAADHVISCDDCVCTVDFAEGDPNTISVSFTVYGSISMT